MKDEHLLAEYWSLGDLFYPCYHVVPAYKTTSTQPCTKINILSVVQATTAIHTYSYTHIKKHKHLYVQMYIHTNTKNIHIIKQAYIFPCSYKQSFFNNYQTFIYKLMHTGSKTSLLINIVYAIHPVFSVHRSCEICVSV